ncbi:MAG: hypothetical protein ACOX2F_09725 [bacterium]
MRVAKIFKTVLPLIFVVAVFASCSSSSKDYFFEQPASFSVLKGAKCNNGSVSYIGFVVDNTEKYGARLMKISGCSSIIDKEFKDGLDKKTGLYIGGIGVSSDQMVVKGEVCIATASSGYTSFLHWKNQSENLLLEKHSGRIVLNKLSNEIKHLPSFGKNILLDFYPSVVRAYNKQGFFFSGSKFGKNHIGYTDIEGNAVQKEVDFTVSEIVVSGGEAYLFDSETGSLYQVDESLETELKMESKNLVGTTLTVISKGRFAFFLKNEVSIFSSTLDGIVNNLEVFEECEISSVTSVVYDEPLEYRGFLKEQANEFVEIYTKEEKTEVPDEDVLLQKDGEVADEDDLEDESAESSDDEETLFDASEGDVLWIATKSGRVFAYDLVNSSWVIVKYSQEETASNPDYYNEMRPYVDSSYTSFPKGGKTDAANVPYISAIHAVRALPVSLTYKLVYEGVIDDSLSNNGTLDEEKTVLSDETADFTQFQISPQTDAIVLANRIDSVDCMVPWNENIVFDILGVISSTKLSVNVAKFKDQIEKCYGNSFSYALFPKEKYSVTREGNGGAEFVGQAVELAAESGDEAFSFSDEYVGLSVKRRSDDVVTEKETTLHVKIKSGVPFAGFNSSDVAIFMTNPAQGKLLLFSPLTRRIVEYGVYDYKVLKVYK